MSKKKNDDLLLGSVSLGEKISIYITTKNAIAYSRSSKSVEAVVIGLERPYLDTRASNILLGWREGNPYPKNPSYSYNYHRANDSPTTVDRAILGKIGNELALGPLYYYVDDIKEYFRAIWMPSRTPIPRMGAPGLAGLAVCTEHLGKIGPFRFITATDILPGDTIAWNDDGKSAYLSVQEIDEYEGTGDTPMVALRGNVFNAKGMRVFASGYPMAQNTQVILINRE